MRLQDNQCMLEPCARPPVESQMVAGAHSFRVVLNSVFDLWTFKLKFLIHKGIVSRNKASGLALYTIAYL